jgi:hypothetical protein
VWNVPTYIKITKKYIRRTHNKYTIETERCFRKIALELTVVFLLANFFFYHIYEGYLEISMRVASEWMTYKEMPVDFLELYMDYRVLVMANS